jgi:hypothetical protein
MVSQISPSRRPLHVMATATDVLAHSVHFPKRQPPPGTVPYSTHWLKGTRLAPTKPLVVERWSWMVFLIARNAKGGTCQAVWYGPWYLKRGTATGYLGLSFQLNGETYYGWAQLSVNKKSGKGITATLTGYAYEAIPGMPINAGQTKDTEDAFALSPAQ